MPAYSATRRFHCLLVALLLVTALLPFLLLSYFNHPFMDDYYNTANTRRLGLWAVQKDLYLNWSGRYFSSFLVTAANPMRLGWYDGLRLTPALFLLLTLSTFYLGVRALTRRQLARSPAVGVAVLVLLLYLHLIPEPYSAFYWFTGAVVYQVAGLATLLVFIATAHAHQSSPLGRRGWQLLALSSTVAAAASNEMSFAHLLLGTTLLLAWAGSRREWPMARWWTLVLGVALLAGVPTLVAPGNFVRMQFEFSSNVAQTSPLTALLQAPEVVWGYTSQFVSWLLLLKGILLTGIWLVLVAGWQQRGWLPAAVRLPWYAGLALWITTLLLTLLLFQLTTARMPPPRAENGIWLFLLPLWLLAVAAAWVAARPAWNLSPGLGRWGMALYLAGFVVLTIPKRAWQELVLSAPSYDRQLLAREAQLRGAQSWKQGQVVVPPLTGIKPYHVLISGWDLSTNPAHYVNTETALYFGLESVRIDAQQLPAADPAFHNQQP